MTARETLARARSAGNLLGESDAKVAAASTLRSEHRAWLGVNGSGRTVAYFEIGGRDFSPYAVSHVIEVTPVEVSIGDPAEDVKVAKVVCDDSRLDAVFVQFMDDVISKLSDQHPIDALVGCAADWRHLLRVAKDGLSDAAMAGLFGELCFLSDAVRRTGPAAVRLWQRDPQDVHDFTAEQVHVEVKTSKFQNRQAITIHGLNQMRLPQTARLVLAVAEVEKGPSGKRIDDVVDAIISLGVSADELTDKLAAYGYVKGMNGPDSDLGFDIRSWRFWEIVDDSPVVSSTVLDDETVAAISDVTYSLSLAALGEPSDTFSWELIKPEAAWSGDVE